MSAVLRQAATVSRTVLRSQARSLSTSPVTRKDFVQDLYIKELKSYKAPPPAKDAHVGSVKPFSRPSVPKAPVLPADIASELSAYDAEEPVKAAKPAAETVSVEEVGTGAVAFLETLEADLPKEDYHHH